MKKSAICFGLIVALSGCSAFSKNAKQQRAYEKYVRKSSLARDKQKLKFRASNTDVPLRQTPAERTAEPNPPESVSASEPPPDQ
jgi:uncharacterized lipoprotein